MQQRHNEVQNRNKTFVLEKNATLVLKASNSHIQTYMGSYRHISTQWKQPFEFKWGHFDNLFSVVGGRCFYVW